MSKRGLILLFGLVLLIAGIGQAQMTPWAYWTLLTEEQMDYIIGEASGETAWYSIMETGGYAKDRLAKEWDGTFYESQYILDQLKHYGLPGAELVRFPGGKTWDGIKGELWEVKPNRMKIASYLDHRAMLASGSTNTDVTAELVWVGRGTKAEITAAEVAGKIVVTEGRMSSVHSEACQKQGALGVIAISTSRPYFDPLQMPWNGVRSWRATSQQTPKFGFSLPVREGDFLKKRLLNREKITVHAVVEARMEAYDLQDVTCYIPGTDPAAGEIIFSAHLFEGYNKQGANDNKSGSATILEIARVLHTLIEDGRLLRPKRTIRFLWGPEFSGTGPWVTANKKIMDRTLCNINLDMVGEWLSKNKAFMCMMRTTYGNAHYINDVMENYYRFVGEGSRERIQNRSTAYKVPHRIVAPFGADEPFYYSIETHYGASDHEIFNDWSVQVPGIMMIVWPDQWYHTSGDTVDKADPTQLKRATAIGAAAAYTIASADADMAVKIAGEVAGNGTRRLGHQFTLGQVQINKADAEKLDEAYKMARNYVQTAMANEKDTLASVLELAPDFKTLRRYIYGLQQTIDTIGNSHLDALKAHMQIAAKSLEIDPVKIELTELEKQAAALVPKRTAKMKALGYREDRALVNKVPSEAKKEYPFKRNAIGSSSELQALINGKRSALDIKNCLDAQYTRKSNLQSVINYLKVLELAGLIDM